MGKVPEIIHCRIKGCKWAKRVKNFEEGMAAIRHHRKNVHPKEWEKSITKSAQTRSKK
jgi:ATP-dependent 26S proteasome regulatory subunit